MPDPDPRPADPAGATPDGPGAAADLDQALARMRWRVLPGCFALVGLEGGPDAPDLRGPLARLGPPAQVVVEADELTVLAPEAQVDELLRLRPGAPVERDLCWVRFEAPMGWEVVGFLARVTGALAAAGVPLGAVCGYSRDHLFVGRRHLDTARRVLGELFPEA